MTPDKTPPTRSETDIFFGHCTSLNDHDALMAMKDFSESLETRLRTAESELAALRATLSKHGEGGGT